MSPVELALREFLIEFILDDALLRVVRKLRIEVNPCCSTR